MTPPPLPEAQAAQAAQVAQAAPAPRPAVEPVTHRVRRWCVAALLGLLPWFVAPGLTMADTKLDLVVSPARYLARAFTAWNTHTGVGELQNQAYGYLWPMGPFFALADALNLPAWATQRAWWTLLLVLAFVGVERLIRRLTTAGSMASVIGGLSYALAPRVLTLISENSVETWPVALAPWLMLVLLPAVRAQALPSDRRRAALRTVPLVATLGGVNATASLAALLPALVWLMCAPRAAHRARTAAWWLPAVALGSLWWLAPLVILGRYAYPFMDFIESAATTTAVTSVSNVLRGTDHWVGWILDGSGHPVWQSGWVLAQYVPAIMATCAVAGVALWGLATATNRHLARWAACCLIVGVVAMAAGHGGTATSPLAPWLRELLDGPLSPARNVHKVDLMVRLPFAVGIALAVCRMLAWVRPRQPAVRVAAGGVALALFVGATLPVWLGRVGDAWPWREVPREWRHMATTVDVAADTQGGATLLLPASRFGDYAWGTPDDEPLSALATSPVLVRGSAPLGHPGLTRVLDDLDLAAAQGRAVPGLKEALSRIGVERIVLRRNLSASVQAEDWRQVELTLKESGLTSLQTVGTGTNALTLYAVADGGQRASAVTAYPQDSLVTVGGGPEAIPQLLASGDLSPDTGAVLAADPQVATDGLRLRSFNAGRPTLLAYGPTVATLPATARPDLPPADGTLPQTTRVWGQGIAGVSASSSAADPFSRQPVGQGAGLPAALDGDPATAWLSGDRAGEQWLTIDRSAGAPAGELSATIATGEAITPIASVRVAVDGKEIASRREGNLVRADLPAGQHSVRILLRAGFAPDGKPVIGLSEVNLPGRGVGPASSLVVPAGPATTGIILAPSQVARSVDGRQGEDSLSSWRRTVTGLDRASAWTAARVELTPHFGSDLDRRLDGVALSASSRRDPLPQHRGGAALDGDPSTAWHPAVSDTEPTLRLSLPNPPRSVQLGGGPTGVQVLIAQQGRPSTILRDNEKRAIELSNDSPVTITYYGVRAGDAVPDVVFDRPPVGTLDGLKIACGDTAPSVEVEALTTRFAGTWSRAELMAGAPVTGRACEQSMPVRASTSANDLPVVAAAGQGAAVTKVDVRRVEPVPAAQPVTHNPRGVRVISSSPGHYVVDVDAGPAAVLTLAEGANPGWVARASSQDLAPRTIDGWRAGFALPAGVSTRVRIDFSPDRAYRWGIAAGLGLALFALLGVVVDAVRRRRVAPRPAMGPVDGWDRRVTRSQWSTAGVMVGVAVMGFAVAGWVGVLCAALALATPRVWRPQVALAAMTVTGVGLCAFGAAEQFSAGALIGQVGGALSASAAVASLVGAPGLADLVRWSSRARRR